MSEEDKKTETVAVAVAMPADAQVSASEGEKRGAKCCGCCCDYRRACVVMAIIGIVYSGALLIVSLIVFGVGTAVVINATEEQVTTQENGFIVGMGGAVVAVTFGMGLLISVFYLVAALKFNVCMLSTVLVFQLISLALNIYASIASQVDVVSNIVGSIVIAALFMYPNVGLLMEIKAGIMSRETYAREAYSCCCTPQV